MLRKIGQGIRFVLLLPFRVLWLIIRLPVLLFRGWRYSARQLYRFRKRFLRPRQACQRLQDAYRWLRLRLQMDYLLPGLYFHLHPLRGWHALCSLRTRLRGANAWNTTPGLAAVPKAIRWGRQYRRHTSRFGPVEALRSTLYANDTVLDDFPYRPTVGFLARRLTPPRRWGALLHGLVRYTEAQRVLELGAGFGITGLYLARGLLDNYPVRTCLLVTLEEQSDFTRIARSHFSRLGYSDIVVLLEGRTEDRLAEALDQIAPLNLAFVDTRHDENATLRYFSQIKARSRPGTLIVISGIHRTPAMARAWRAMQDMRHVAATVDLWRWGIVVIGNGPPRRLCARL